MVRLFGLCLVLAVLAGPARAQELLTLPEAVALALENNYAIRIGEGQAAIAGNNYALGNAGFLPRLSVGAGYNGTIANTTQTFLDGQPNERTGAQTTRESVSAQLTWTAFEGLRRFATYDRLETLWIQEQTAALRTAETVLADVVVAYVNLTRQQAQLDVLAETVAISEERLRIAELRRDLGSASELEVRQARLDLNADRAAFLRQQTALVVTKADFNQLLVRPLGLDYVVADSIVLDLDVPREALLEMALARNSALVLAEQARAVNQLELREIRAERLPSLDVSAGYGFSNLEAESGFLLANRSTDFTYGLTLNFDVFDGFNRRRRAENAAVRIRNADLAIEDVRTRLQADVARFYEEYANSLELIALEEENRTLARLNVEVALERFRLGTITSVELREVQEALTLAQSRLLVARFEAKRAETELRRLAGLLRPTG